MNDNGLWTDSEHPSLSIAELDRVLRAIERPRIYYLAHESCPTKVEGIGKDVLFSISLIGLFGKLVVMHPGLLPRFITRAKIEGFEPIQFEIERHYSPIVGKVLTERVLREHTARLVQWLTGGSQ